VAAYARPMDEPTQAPGPAPADPPPPGAGDAGTGVPTAPAPGESERDVPGSGSAAADPATAPPELGGASGERPIAGAAVQRGLLAWLGILVAGGLGSLALGHAEGALLFAGAGAFALAQATDAAASLERYREVVRHALPRGSARGILVRALVRSLVPLAGAFLYAALGAFGVTADPGHPQRVAVAWCAGAAIVSLALAFRPVADACSRLFFGPQPGRTRRLTARLVVLALLMPVPGVLLGPALIDTARASGTVLADPGALVAQLLGEVAIALAGVGWLVRREGRAVLARLGLERPRPAHLLVALGGVLALIALNAGGDALEHAVFPALWTQDRDVTRFIAEGLPLTTALLLGVSAGVGEEVVVRGALQPRLGILLSAIVFASGHVQYSWFGMTTIALLGVTLGVVRARTNTTTAILVHVLYDVFAALTAGS
jgi:membrane protease YdiL (CAAX protease family)